MTKSCFSFLYGKEKYMETFTQNLLEQLSNINENVSLYKEISLKPLQDGNDIVARIVSVEESTREYVDRTKRNVGVLLWVLAKHESSITTIDALLKIENYLLQQGGKIVKDAEWEMTSEDGKDVYSIVCKLSI